jgi:hypothetical protein
VPVDSDSIDLGIRFTSRAITAALRSLEQVLGRATVEAIEYDFETYGLPLVNEHVQYSYAEIRTAVEKIFGEAAPLFLERFDRALIQVWR